MKKCKECGTLLEYTCFYCEKVPIVEAWVSRSEDLKAKVFLCREHLLEKGAASDKEKQRFLDELEIQYDPLTGIQLTEEEIVLLTNLQEAVKDIALHLKHVNNNLGIALKVEEYIFSGVLSAKLVPYDDVLPMEYVEKDTLVVKFKPVAFKEN